MNKNTSWNTNQWNLIVQFWIAVVSLAEPFPIDNLMSLIIAPIEFGHFIAFFCQLLQHIVCSVLGFSFFLHGGACKFRSSSQRNKWKVGGGWFFKEINTNSFAISDSMQPVNDHLQNVAKNMTAACCQCVSCQSQPMLVALVSLFKIISFCCCNCTHHILTKATWADGWLNFPFCCTFVWAMTILHILDDSFSLLNWLDVFHFWLTSTMNWNEMWSCVPHICNSSWWHCWIHHQEGSVFLHCCRSHLTTGSVARFATISWRLKKCPFWNVSCCFCEHKLLTKWQWIHAGWVLHGSIKSVLPFLLLFQSFLFTNGKACQISFSASPFHLSLMSCLC